MKKTIDDSWLTTAKSESELGPLELDMYRDHRRELLTWMLNEGKAPDAKIGYAKETVKNRAHRLDLFYRWVWDIEDGYTEEITTTHANAWTKYFHSQPHSKTYKLAVQKAILNLFKWYRYEKGKDVEWDPVIRYKSSTHPSSREALTREERTKLREAAVDYGSIPHYNSLSPEERARYKRTLSMRLEKPKNEISKQDFLDENSWKWPSLIWTSMDAGLRPKEVGRAKVDWVDADAGVLRIPPEDTDKNDTGWTGGLLDRTVTILQKWIDERECRENTMTQIYCG